jgi:hypothetical protein
LIQLLLLAALLLIVFYGVRGFLKTAPRAFAGELRKGMLWLGLILLILLAATGRLGWLVPLIGAVTVGLVRLAPYLLQLLPVLHKLRRRDEGKAKSGSASGRMSREEAYQILGLAPGATREKIIEAHRRLIQKLHPDRGGSDYLAAKLNQAKDTLLGR